MNPQLSNKDRHNVSMMERKKGLQQALVGPLVHDQSAEASE